MVCSMRLCVIDAIIKYTSGLTYKSLEVHVVSVRRYPQRHIIHERYKISMGYTGSYEARAIKASGDEVSKLASTIANSIYSLDGEGEYILVLVERRECSLEKIHLSQKTRSLKKSNMLKQKISSILKDML